MREKWTIIFQQRYTFISEYVFNVPVTSQGGTKGWTKGCFDVQLNLANSKTSLRKFFKNIENPLNIEVKQDVNLKFLKSKVLPQQIKLLSEHFTIWMEPTTL